MNTTTSLHIGSLALAALLMACSDSMPGSNADATRVDAGAERDAATLIDAGASSEAMPTRTVVIRTIPFDAGALPAASDGPAAEPSAAGDGAAAAPNERIGDAGAMAIDSLDGLDAGAQMELEPSTETQLLCAECGGCEEVQPVLSTQHTTDPVVYHDPPPTSGPHNPCWARWGIHEEPTPAQRWVHNLEHGGVVFLYNCPQGCDAEVNKLREMVSARERTILTAYDALPARFGIVAWGHRLVSDCLDEAAFSAFYANHFDRAPESVATEPNPGCPP